jgi:hypothetical protein
MMKKFFSIFLVGILLMLTLAGCNYSVDMGFGSTYHYENADDYVMGGASLSDAISEIEIGWVSGSVTVQYHDGDTVLISETCSKALEEKTSLYYRVVGDTLMIQYAKSGVWTNIDFQKDLTVSLPKPSDEEGSVITEYDLSIETVSADVEILGIQAKKCEFENVSGEILSSLLGEMTSLQVENVSGTVSIHVDRLDRFDIESVSGNVSLTGGDIRSGDIETVSGNVSLYIPPNHGYTVDFDSVSGDIDLHGTEVSKIGDRYTVGDGSRKYDVETVSGDVKISEYKA